MKTVIIDDEKLAALSLIRILKELDPAGEHIYFLSSLEALEHLKIHSVNVIFLDIEMPELSGTALVREVKKLRPKMNFIFVTGHTQYSLEAHGLYAAGYLLKPASSLEVLTALDHLRHPVAGTLDHIRIQTFGNFEVFVDGIPLHFGRAKAKELLAYLVDRRGSASTIAEIASILWEDKPYTRSLQSQNQTIVSEMMKTLKEAGLQNIMIKKRNSLAVDVNSFVCDYYSFLQGDMSSINSFSNEYMTNYSWAEFTVGLLTDHSKKS